MPDFDHLFLDERFVSTLPYTTTGRGMIVARGINRQDHGHHIHARFEEAVEDFKEGREEQDFVYIEFTSAIDFELDLGKFENTRKTYRIAYVQAIEVHEEDGQTHIYYRCGVYLDQNAIADFLKMVEEYLTKESPQSIRAGNPKPMYNTFISNIQDIRAATLKSFWQEAEDDFPLADQEVWWEVWLDNQGLDNVLEFLTPALEPFDIQIGLKWLHFPERSVGLIKGAPAQLSASLLYTNRLAELRKPRETADFFTGLERADQSEFIDDLRNRVDNLTDGSAVRVCLLDTGVTRTHPLLEDLVPEDNLTTEIPNVGVNDGGSGTTGHGTPMAGLILYGDLSDVLTSQERVQIYHHLESIKLIRTGEEHDPENYGFVTQQAMDTAIIFWGDQNRIYCLAVTSETLPHHGAPTSWSAAVDQYAFGRQGMAGEESLILVSSGNLPFEEIINYPLSNWETSIHEPGQAFNALTIGSYTQADTIDPEIFPGAQALAPRGAMAPSNTTSLMWRSHWPLKPDVVMEGGNYAGQHGSTISPDSLFPLSTAKGTATHRGVTTFGDTSGATALASRMAAMLYHRYPHLRPETIRALLVHAADWTPVMLGAGIHNVQSLGIPERIHLLRQVGYGVPDLHRSCLSAENSLTLIAESDLTPYKWENSSVKTNEFHLYTLPWPTDVLEALGATLIKLKITLSYFIEPNPGNKTYSNPQNYASHGLRFQLISPTESLKAFKGRVSKAMQDESYESEGDNTGWMLGPKVRNKGSIHKDIWEGTAADLASRSAVAIHPIGGWWKNRKKLQQYTNTAKYSLAISIEAPDTEVDLYNPILQKIENFLPIDIEI